MGAPPCPVCDLHRTTHDNTVVAFALGVSLGVAFRDMHRITELTCEAHRTDYVVAMAGASMLANETGTCHECGADYANGHPHESECMLADDPNVEPRTPTTPRVF